MDNTAVSSIVALTLLHTVYHITLHYIIFIQETTSEELKKKLFIIMYLDG